MLQNAIANAKMQAAREEDQLRARQKLLSEEQSTFEAHMENWLGEVSSQSYSSFCHDNTRWSEIIKSGSERQFGVRLV